MIAKITGLQDEARAMTLAKAFRGRWVPAEQGYDLTPANFARFSSCYSFGFMAAFRLGRWQLCVPGERPWLDKYDAVRIAKEAQKEAACQA